VIKYRINDIKTHVSAFAKKLRNRIRYRNLSELIQPAFGKKENILAYNQTRVTGPEPCVCHAPLRSLYFDIHGKATACCFNRAHVLGKFPENSISEIINSDKRMFLQTELCRQNFMYGCQHCHKLIEAGNFDGVEARLYDNLKDQGITPSEITFELDNTCNLECVMCHEEFSSTIAKAKGLERIRHPYNAEFLEQLRAYIPKLKVAKFLGGEPFLINIYYEIWDLILELNPKCRINLQTNGTIFNDRVKSYLDRGNFYIGISIDSLQKDRYESIRKNAVFEDVMSNIDKFIEISRKKNNYVNISVCPMQQNRDEIPDLVNFCNQKNVFIYFNTVYTAGFAISELSEEELLEMLTRYRAAKFNAKGVIAKRNLRFYNDLISNFESWYQVKEQASRLTRRRHNWNSELLKEVLVSKAAKDDFTIELIIRIFQTLNEEFLLSDQEVENLNSVKSDELIFAANNETEEQLRERIKRFIDKGKFGE